MYVRRCLRPEGADRFHERLRAGHRRHARHTILQRCSPDCLFVVMRCTTKGRIDHERYLTALDMVHEVRAARVDLENCFDVESDFNQARRCSECRDDTETE